MAIAKVQDAASHNLGSTGGDTTFGAGATAGNLIILFIWIETTPQTVTSSGFTSLQASTAVYQNSILYKVATGGETTITAAWTNSTSSSESYMIELSGVDNVTPIDVNGSFQTEGFGGDDFSINSITLTTNAWDMIYMNIGSQAGYSMVTSGYTMQVDKQAMGIATKALSSGATGTRTGNNPNFGSRAWTSFGVRQSGGGGGGSTGWGRLIGLERNRLVRNRIKRIIDFEHKLRADYDPKFIEYIKKVA